MRRPRFAIVPADAFGRHDGKRALEAALLHENKVRTKLIDPTRAGGVCPTNGPPHHHSRIAHT